MKADILIVGGGASGLSLARALTRRTSLKIVIVEKQSRQGLGKPDYDGREIALTHFSKNLLSAFGIWQPGLAAHMSPIRRAEVRDGDSSHSLGFECPVTSKDQILGHLVSHHLIRRALFESVVACPQITLLDGCEVAGVTTGKDGVSVTLTDGRCLSSALLVAADGRFSALRRQSGIAAEMRDFGRTMLLCRVSHDKPHHQVASENFGYGYTLAMLPLAGRESSAVLTVPARQVNAMTALSDDRYARHIAKMFSNRLGEMRVSSPRFAYPLVATYANRFFAERTALIGDAAVGMHPVTAHGFNLGLKGASRLADCIGKAVAAGTDWGASGVLAAYHHHHQRVTRPLYLGTNAVVRLYNDESLPARLIRPAFIRLSDRMGPIKQAITRGLMARNA